MASSNLPAAPTEYSIIVAQYKRNDGGVGIEENLHWAIFVAVDEKKVEGLCFQVINVKLKGQPLRWALHNKPIELFDSKKCLGGVRIGSVKVEELDELQTMLDGHPPNTEKTPWNCHSWVMECIAMMQPRGWIAKHITDEQTILRGMQIASVKSEEALHRGDKPVLVSMLQPL